MVKSSGARFTKLKKVYKRAIQEILKTQDILNESSHPDSFYNFNKSINVDFLKEKYTELQKSLSDLFCEKAKFVNLENKLDRLDILIKEYNGKYKDHTDNLYIQEVLESYLVDDKFQVVELCKEKISEIETEIKRYEIEMHALRKEKEMLQEDCMEMEDRVNSLMKGMKSSFV